MSPRSEEYFWRAKRCLKSASQLLETELYEDAVSRAYYAMFEAAHAALSEFNESAKTHSGTWSLFNSRFIRNGVIDEEWSSKCAKAQRMREKSDYDVKAIESADAREIVESAQEFVNLIESLFD